MFFFSLPIIESNACEISGSLWRKCFLGKSTYTRKQIIRVFFLLTDRTSMQMFCFFLFSSGGFQKNRMVQIKKKQRFVCYLMGPQKTVCLLLNGQKKNARRPFLFISGLLQKRITSFEVCPLYSFPVLLMNV